MKTSNQTREASSNPEMLEKSQNLKSSWDSLSNAQRRQGALELKALGCTNTYLARLLGLTESAIRYYLQKTARKSARAAKAKLTKSEDVKPVSAAPEYDDELLQEMIDYHNSRNSPPPPSRKDQIRECSNAFVAKFAPYVGTRFHFLDLVGRRCLQWEVCDPLPKPVPENIAPATVFQEFSEAGLDLEPLATVEFLAVSLLRLVPESYQREQLLRELGTL